ncbi:DUF6320 domain-containing protein [Desulfoluna spongiiphila]|uniref:Uncharacterized protein n=1 Tax=Desulfoluna spongiiphila TaxID=419481 RepID=A0A1G5FFH0_9BACT|nr:DUF6320 domain-containing protein [Desulfoluna spongiiphila]SCY37927.1 hypothetical protein SAMN05216233_10838 [Desulfoluna spongiiphila]
MPYCPGCGVEVESVVRSCPLCDQEIPIIEGINDGKGRADETFPAPANIYGKKLRRLKNQIFFSVTLVVACALFTLGFLHSFLHMQSMSIQYGVVGVVSAWFYALLILGYVPGINHTIMGFGIVSALLVTGIDAMDSQITWARGIGVPLIVLATAMALAVIRIYRRFRHKNQYVVIPIYLCTCVSIFCPAIELIIDLHLTGAVALSWSVIVFIPLMTLACLLLGLYLKLPERLRSKIKKKLHI